jgi:DNA-directed RNA polymerase subunit RPC12/RpoP
MIRYENECVGCSTPAYPCMGDSCPNLNVPHLYCDECGFDVDDLYEYDDEQICEECLLKRFNKVKV